MYSSFITAIFWAFLNDQGLQLSKNWTYASAEWPVQQYLSLLRTIRSTAIALSIETVMGTFADDTAIFATHADPTTASRNLQEHLNTAENWLKKWKIKVNETKSSHITFTLRKEHCPAISINQTVLPQVESVKYLGLHFDCKLNWKEHIIKKRRKKTT